MNAERESASLQGTIPHCGVAMSKASRQAVAEVKIEIIIKIAARVRYLLFQLHRRQATKKSAANPQVFICFLNRIYCGS